MKSRRATSSSGGRARGSGSRSLVSTTGGSSFSWKERLLRLVTFGAPGRMGQHARFVERHSLRGLLAHRFHADAQFLSGQRVEPERITHVGGFAPHLPQLSAPVIPERAPGTVFEILAPMPKRPPQHAQMLPQGIEMRFAGRRDHWMTMQNNQFLSALSRLLPEPFAELYFLGGVKRLAESAKLAERFWFAENKRTGRPSFHPADRVPDGREEFRPADRVVHFDHRPAAQ